MCLGASGKCVPTFFSAAWAPLDKTWARSLTVKTDLKPMPLPWLARLPMLRPSSSVKLQPIDPLAAPGKGFFFDEAEMSQRAVTSP